MQKQLFILSLSAALVGCQQGTKYISQEEYAAQLAADRARVRANEAAEKQQIAAVSEARQKYLDEHPNISQQRRQAVAGGELVRGMTVEEFRLLWNEPDSINSTVGAWGKREQWVFERGLIPHPGVKAYWGTYYLYFDNGVLDSWQHRPRSKY
jgi:hypothetical protein